MTAPEPHDAWWTIHSSVVQEMLRRAFHGEDPDLLYVELIANSRIGFTSATTTGLWSASDGGEPVDNDDAW
jgi:hypothetical protein